MAWMGGRPLPSSRSQWVGKVAQPLTHPAEESPRTPFLQCRQPWWGWMKQKYGGEWSRGNAMIWWAHRQLQGRMARIADEGPDGTPAGTTHPDGCERAALVETTPISVLQPLLRGHGEVRHPSRLWWCWVRTKAGGQGQLQSPTAPLRQKLPITCCHRPALSLPPNETRLRTLAGGCWSGWEKRMGETSLCDEREARETWAGVSSAGRWDPLSLSEKKVIRECREVRLMFSKWEQSEPASAASAWGFYKQKTHSLWPSSACRGDLHEPQ